jgi:hypothetical protein
VGWRSAVLALVLVVTGCASLRGLVGADTEDDDAPQPQRTEDAGADVTIADVSTSVGDTDATPPSTLLRAVTFEDGIVVYPDTGATFAMPTVKPVTAEPLEGVYSAEVDGQDSYFEIAIPPQTDLYVAFAFRLLSDPNGTPRPLRFDIAGVSIELGTGNRLRLLSAGGAREGASDVLARGEAYRIGLHVRTGEGTASAEAYLSAGTAPFGAPFATFSGETVSAIAKLILGSGNDGMHAVYDDVRVDSSRMP